MSNPRIRQMGLLVRPISRFPPTPSGRARFQQPVNIQSPLDSVKVQKKGDKVTLIGFGTLSVTKRAARKGRNPQTGKEIKIDARKIPKFTPVKGLKVAVK